MWFRSPALRRGSLSRAAWLGVAVLCSVLARDGVTPGHAATPITTTPPAETESSAASPDRGVAAMLHITGAIGPATSRYVERGLEDAQARGDALAILELDTPGGLDTAMRDIIRAILASRIPVIGYVAPPGARAASAGTYILYACQVAAMAPATNVGAATPIEIGGTSTPRREPSAGGSGQSDTPGGPPLTTEERKQINDAVAYIRGLAELRGRNAAWAEQAVRGAASLSADAALQTHVIDLIARDVPDLLRQLDGRRVKVGNETVALATRGVTTRRIDPDWRTRFLSVITHPTIAYGLMLIGIYGLLLEGYNPGAMLPGVVGAISLVIALFAFEVLSVNFAGFALIVLGIGMIVGEFFFPTFGSLGIGGLIAFVAGSIILFDTGPSGPHLALPIIAGVATAGGLILLGLVFLGTRSLRRPVVTGREAMIGATAEAFEDFDEQGRVRLGGELWNAHTSRPVRAGQSVRIVRMDGLKLWVEPV